MFSWPNKWEHVSFGRNKMSVELAQKNLVDLHCTFFMQHKKKKTSSAAQKNLADLHCTFFMQHQKKKTSSAVQKNLVDLHCTFFMQHQNMITSTAVKKTLSVSERFQIKIVQCRLKNISRGYFTTDVGY